MYVNLAAICVILIIIPLLVQNVKFAPKFFHPRRKLNLKKTLNDTKVSEINNNNTGIDFELNHGANHGSNDGTSMEGNNEVNKNNITLPPSTMGKTKLIEIVTKTGINGEKEDNAIRVSICPKKL